MNGSDKYIGRFAPSPTGPLHLGSLVSALGSWADARHHKGKWLVRVEDIDPQRESSQATEQIINSLRAHHLHWDDKISYQHQHAHRYEAALDVLRQQEKLFACTCSRKNLRALNQSNYPGTCREQKHAEGDKALRVKIDDTALHFVDEIYGKLNENVHDTVGDFIVRRRGPLYAYQLAVVVDDAEQHVSHIVRGSDLLDNTARQIALQRLLNYPTPKYLHLPLALHSDGRKLSKQTGATALDDTQPLDNLRAAWRLLGQANAPKTIDSCAAFLSHCSERWDRQQLPVEISKSVN